MKESAIQTAIEKYLANQEAQDKLVYIKNNTARVPIRGHFYRFGKKGSSDFLVFLPNKTVFLEVKTPTGTQSKFQKEFQAKVSRLGFDYVIVTSKIEAKEVIDRYLSDLN